MMRIINYMYRKKTYLGIKTYFCNINNDELSSGFLLKVAMILPALKDVSTHYLVFCNPVYCCSKVKNK